MSSSPNATLDASSVPRRVSGRVRRQPNKYNSGAKRKRDTADGGDDVDMRDHDDSGESSMSEDEGSDAGGTYGNPKRARTRKAATEGRAIPQRAAPKKAKVNGASLPIRSMASGTTKRAVKKKVVPTGLETADVGGLYAEVFSGSANIDDIAGQWVQDFQQHESRALADVMNLVLACAGCKIKVTEEDIEDADCVSTRLTDIQDEFQASRPTDYPLAAKGKAGDSFKSTMTTFLTTLIKAIAASDLLYENTALIENIQMWFSTLSSAANRAFRHTATVASLCVMTALCEIGQQNALELAAKQRQVETERKKSKPNKSRIKDMEARAKEANKVAEFIEVQLKDWFDVLFIHRYRDIDALIRRECIESLGDWIVLMPDLFLDGQHLRYLGWLLSDPVSATRAEVIKQLQRLYKQKSAIGGLKTFTERFRARLIEIATLDAESTVRSLGIELLDLLREDGLLEPDDIDAVGRLIYDSDQRVRKTVARFFAENVVDLYNSKLDDLGGLETLEEVMPEIGNANFEAPQLLWLKYKSLAEMMAVYDTDEVAEKNEADKALLLYAAGTKSRFTLAADVLCAHVRETEDWRALSGYLMHDHLPSRTGNAAADDDLYNRMKQECVLNDLEEVILLHVLNASVRRAVAELDDGSAAARVKLSRKQREDLLEDEEELARALAALIPSLLRKFGDSPSTTAAVLHLENVLSLPALKGLRQEPADKELLDSIRKQFMSHNNDEVLAAASDALLHAKAQREPDNAEEGELSGLWEEVSSNLIQLLDADTISTRGASHIEDLIALHDNLLRIARLAQVSNCVIALEKVDNTQLDDSVERRSMVDYLIALIQRALPESSSKLDAEDAMLEDQIATRAAESVLRYMQWKFSYIKDTVSLTSRATISFDELEVLATRRDAYFDTVLSVLRRRKPNETVSVALMRLMLDLSVSAKVLTTIKPRPGVSDEYEALAVALDKNFFDLVVRIFVATETTFAKLSGKKINDRNTIQTEEDINADPIEDDPLTDSGSAVGEQPSSRADVRLRHAIVAERELCELTRSIIFAVHAGVLDVAATRRRLERNKTKLGPNFKEMLTYLDIGKVSKAVKSTANLAINPPQANGRSVGKSNKRDPKSNAIVAEDETDDDIEDDDGHAEGMAPDEAIDEDSGLINGVSEHGDGESVIGD